MQERILLDRDRVASKTWYSEGKNRWEMDPLSVPYAVSRNLVQSARIRHDFGAMYIMIKGDEKEYYVDVKVSLCAWFWLFFNLEIDTHFCERSLLCSLLPGIWYTFWRFRRVWWALFKNACLWYSNCSSAYVDSFLRTKYLSAACLSNKNLLPMLDCIVEIWNCNKGQEVNYEDNSTNKWRYTGVDCLPSCWVHNPISGKVFVTSIFVCIAGLVLLLLGHCSCILVQRLL